MKITGVANNIHDDPETETAKWDPAIICFFLKLLFYTCAFPAVSNKATIQVINSKYRI